MEKLDQYRHAVGEVIRRHSGYKPAVEGLEKYTVRDTEGDHDQIVRTGWANQHWYYGVILHFDLKVGKVWTQHNGTEHDVAAELVELGVAPADIVLGFYSPYMRKFTGYAVA